MDIRKDKHICAVCCNPFTTRRRANEQSHLQSYQKLLCEQLSLTTFPPLLVCSNCVACVVLAVEKREEVVALEENVRRLQVQLLAMLGSLQERIMEFKEGFRNVEGTILEGMNEGDNASRRLDAFFLEGDSLEDDGGRLKNAIQIREKFSLLVEDLRSFKNSLSLKTTAPNPDLIPPKLEADHNDLEDDCGGAGSDNCSEHLDPSNVSGTEDEEDDKDPEFVPEANLSIKRTKVTAQRKRKGKVKAHDEKRCQCSSCGKCFLYPSYLKLHEESHRQDNHLKYLCPDCGKGFKQLTGFSYHRKYVCFPGKGMVPQDSVYRFQCHQCPKKFPLEGKLKKHEALVHSVMPRNFKCGLCEKAFTTKDTARRHERTHSDARPFSCRRAGCDADYKTTKDRNRHEKSCKRIMGQPETNTSL